jgi:DNA-binding transcriptional MerR regulator
MVRGKEVKSMSENVRHSLYTTGEMAKLCNISVRTVQFYDTKGLLHPSDLSEGGRRLYTDDDLVKLRLICTLKTIGLSLDLIKGILGSESPGKVLTLLLDEQTKLLGDEIEERQMQLETINAIKSNIQGNTAIPVNLIIDIERIMEKNKEVRKKFNKLVFISCLITLPTITVIAIWVAKGMWIPFVIWFPIHIILGVFLARYNYKNTAFICAECNCVFRPTFKSVVFTSGTTKARWLTCLKCGHAGYCVETIYEETVS